MADVECSHVWDLVLEEMECRGWDRETMAKQMGGDIAVNLCTLDLLSLEDPRLLLGDKTAASLARAFGTSAKFWLNIDRRWREFVSTQKEG